MLLNNSLKQSIRLIDAFLDNFTLSTLIVKNGQALLELEIGEYLQLNDNYEIQIITDNGYYPITYQQAINTYCNDIPDQPLFAGFDARVRLKSQRKAG